MMNMSSACKWARPLESKEEVPVLRCVRSVFQSRHDGHQQFLRLAARGHMLERSALNRGAKLKYRGLPSKRFNLKAKQPTFPFCQRVAQDHCVIIVLTEQNKRPVGPHDFDLMASIDKSGRAHLHRGGIVPDTEDFAFVQYQSAQLTANKMRTLGAVN